MTGIVLAGGKASRMGGSCDKAFLKIDGEAVIRRQLRVLRRIFNEIIIVSNSKDSYEDIKGATVVADVIKDRGPIGGIYSGLLSSSSSYNFITACDMPFANEQAIRYMVSNAPGHDVVAPKVDGRCHPLFAVYSRKCVSAVKRLIEEGRLRITEIFSEVDCLYIDGAKLREFDSGLSCLININTKRDYEECLIGR